jgi:hypothetical protein
MCFQTENYFFKSYDGQFYKENKNVGVTTLLTEGRQSPFFLHQVGRNESTPSLSEVYFLNSSTTGTMVL